MTTPALVRVIDIKDAGGYVVNSGEFPPSTSVGGVLFSTLVATPGTVSGQYAYVSGVAAVGLGAGWFQWFPGDSSTPIYGIVGGTYPDGRWKRVSGPPLTPQMTGFDPSGTVAANTTAWDLWLGVVSSSTERYGEVPSGTYILNRNGTPNITSDNVQIRGLGNCIVYHDQAGSPTNGTAAKNAFQAANQTGLTVSGMVFKAITGISFDTCDNVTIYNCQGDGKVLTGAYTGYFWTYGFYLKSCTNVTVWQNKQKNYEFHRYYSGTNVARCKSISDSGNTAQNIGYTTRPGADFPVGVYTYFADDCTIANNVFRNIISAVPGGTRGTGCGFGIYEGDGANAALTIQGNSIVHENFADTRRMDGIFLSAGKGTTVVGNVIRYESDAYGVGIGADIITNDATDLGEQSIIIASNNIDMRDSVTNHYGIQCGTSITSVRRLLVSIFQNTCLGCRIEWNKNHVRSVAVNISQNKVVKTPSGPGIDVNGAIINVNPSVIGNYVEAAFESGIMITGSVRSVVTDNQVYDCNTSNESVDDTKYCGIVFPSLGYGAVIRNNHIENRNGFANSVGGANMRLGIHAFTGTSPFAWKYDDSNTSCNLPPNIPTLFNYFYSAVPTVGIDWKRGDVAYNAFTPAAGNEHWIVTQRIETTLTTNLVAGNVTVQVASTASMAAGDLFVAIVNQTTIDASIGDPTQYYFGSVFSVDSGVQLTLAGAIPGGRTFPIATAKIYVIRFKSSAAIQA